MTGHALLQLMVVLVVAKLAAEVAERCSVPAVLGEIAAGAIIGPSALGLVKGGDFLDVVAEIGVILLLLEVGMEMDLRELAKVGKASLLVAVAGMAVPFVTGWGALVGLGHGGIQAVFLGAALTATSVGITARAFGDLRALASIESRVVIGAAVADDVLGLIVLTVVAPVATGAGIGGVEILSVVGVALVFLVSTTAVGLTLAPKAFTFIHRRALSSGTLVTLAFAFTLALALLASAAELAPIIGAFVAGLALGRTRQVERVSRELAPIGHLFIPVFFLLIGTQADLSVLRSPEVLLLAGAMTIVAIVGKVAAGWMALGTDSDRFLVGIAMVPRGEVGLIFATIGKAAGVLDEKLYAALLIVVLATTVVTPPLLRWRWGLIRSRDVAASARTTVRPDAGWLAVSDNELVLRVEPDPSLVLEVALEVALDLAPLAGGSRPGGTLLDWFDRSSHEPVGWTGGATAALVELLPAASAKSWRFLDATGVFDRAAPELAEAMTRRRRDLGVLDIARLHEWPTVDRVRELTGEAGDREASRQFFLLRHRSLVWLAALIADVAEATDEEQAEALLDRFALPDNDGSIVADSRFDAATLRSAASHLDGLDVANTVVIAAHLGNLERTRRAYLLALAMGELSGWQRARLDELLVGVEKVLTSHTGVDAADAGLGDEESVIERRRSVALDRSSTPTESHRIRTAPSSLVLSLSTTGLLQAMALLEEGAPPPGFARVVVAERPIGNGDAWEVSVVGRNSVGFLAKVASGIGSSGLAIRSAAAATWPDGVALDSFVVAGTDTRPDEEAIGRAVRAAIRGHLSAIGHRALDVSFDNGASPWHTLCVVSGPDQNGLLGSVTAAFAANHVNIQTARCETREGQVSDRFWLTDAKDRKLGPDAQRRIGETIRDGVRGRRARWGSGRADSG